MESDGESGCTSVNQDQMVDGESGCTSVNQDQMVDGDGGCTSVNQDQIDGESGWSMVMVGVLQ